MSLWYNNVVKEVENDDFPQVKVFIRWNRTNVNNIQIDTVVRWIYNVKEMKIRAEKIPKNDIRRYFEV